MLGRGIKLQVIEWLILAGLGSIPAVADNLTNGFETWPSPVTFTNGPNTNYQWVLNNARSRGTGTYIPRSGTNAVWLFPWGSGAFKSTNSWLQTPWLSNGVGTISCWYKNTDSGDNFYSVQYSYDGTNWTSANGSYSVQTWGCVTNTLNLYTNVVLRILKIGDNGNSPYLGLDDVVITNPPARVLFTLPYRDPLEVLDGKTAHILTTITPSALASNISATCYWSTAAGIWSSIPMTNTGGTLWKTVSPIPGHPADEKISYSITAWFQGNDPLSPTNEPPQGTNGPYSFSVGARGYDTGYEKVNITDDFATNMWLVGDYSWEGVYSAASALVNPGFRVSCVTTSSVTNVFGNAEQSTNSLPFTGTTITNGTNIIVSGTNSGQYIVQFNDSNLQYSARQCVYQDFAAWDTGAGYQTTTSSQWIASSAEIGGDAIRGGNFYHICKLESNGTAAIRSPPLPDGIGEVSFYVRNWETNGSPKTECYVQKSYTGSTNPADWVTIGEIPYPFDATNFVRRSFAFNDRYCNYVRILNSTNNPRARLCLAKVMFANAGAGVVFTNIAVSPSRPAASDPVSLYCDAIPMAGASNRVVTAYYRSGTNGSFTPLSMTNTGGDTFVTTNVPAGLGDQGAGVGTVQYYFTCSSEGYQSEWANPIRYPEDGSNGATSYQVIPAQVVFSNVVTVFSDTNVVSQTPVVGSNIYIVADIIPIGGAQYVTAYLYYRFGTNGPFTSVFMDPPGAADPANHFVASESIPAQSVSGTPVQYYIKASFYGPMAMTPTNYPPAGSTGPLTFVIRIPAFRSGYTNMTVSGSFNTNLTQIGDYEWQGLAFSNSVSDPLYRFNGFFPSGNTNWGDTNQAPSMLLPVFGTAEGNAASNIVSTTAYGNVLFRFNESNLEYSIQDRCTYTNFDDWTASGFGNYTNGTWIISNGQTVASSTDDPSRVFQQRGRTCVLNSNSAPSCVLTPYLTNGVGEINFWYRNWETNGYVPTSFDVQTSDGTNPWRTVVTMTNVLTRDYLHFSYTLSDASKHFVRILSGTNSPRAGLCLDDIIVAPPGPCVSFAGVTNSPSTPTINDEVTISSEISTIGGATDITAWVWYRASTNGDYDYTPMTNAGPTFLTSPPVPKGPVGRIQYYIESAFRGFRGNERVHVTYPADGPFFPLSYSNNDAGLVQTFETWPSPVTFTNGPNTNIDEWVLNDARSRGTGTYVPKNGTNAGWLFPWGSGSFKSTNSWLRSPVITNGVGFLTCWMKNTDMGTSFFDIQSSITGTDDWTPLLSSSYDSQVWTNFIFAINNYDLSPLYLRIIKTGDNLNSPYLGLDDVSISPPPAQVAISDVMIHPGYPASNESVRVSCTITSSCPATRAMNITARVHYRPQGGNFDSYSSLEMTKSGDYFFTSQAIPAFPERTNVEYYIESTFQGYHFDDSGSCSPTYAPAGSPSGATNQYYAKPTTYFGYTVRPYLSDYTNVTVAVSVTNVSVTMELLADHAWQGVINFLTDATDPSFLLQGVGHYTGSNYLTGSVRQWGDANQTHSELPFSSTAQLGGPSITNAGTSRGQYLIRFNEADLSYSVQRCSYQDFETWQAPANYFAESINRAGIGLRYMNFDAWPRQGTTNYFEGFDIWEATSGYYPAEYMHYNTVWYVYKSRIISQVGGNLACQFNPVVASNAWVVPSFDGLPDGLGTFSFEYRCVDTNMPLTLCWGETNWTTNGYSTMVQASVAPSVLPNNTNAPLLYGVWSASMFARYRNPSNYYEYRMAQSTNLNGQDYRWLYLYCCSNGTLSQLWKDSYEWPVSSDKTVPFTLNLYLSTYSNASRVNLEGWCQGSRRFQIAHSTPGSLTLPGAVGFRSQDCDIRVDCVTGGAAQVQFFSDWNNPYFYNTSTNGEWIASGGYVTTANGYLQISNRPSLPPANLRSGQLLNGINQIRFAAWRIGSAAPTLRIQTSTTGSTNDGEWTTIYSTNLTGTDANSTYAISTNITDSRYVRFAAYTGNTSRIGIDNVLIIPNSSVCFADNFTTTNSATNWTDLEGKWYVNITNGTYNCAGYNSEPLSLEIQTSSNAPPSVPGESLFYTLTTFSGLVNTRYEKVDFPIQKGDRQYIKLRHSGGEGNIIVDNLNITPWHAPDTFYGGWKAAQGWITTDQALSTNCLELRRSRAYTGTSQYLLSPKQTNGIGTISFYHRKLPGWPVTFRLEYSSGTNDAGIWVPCITVTNNSESWMGYLSQDIGIQGEWYFRILNTTSNLAAGLLIDDLLVSDYATRDEWTWVGYNVLVTHTNTTRLLSREGNKKGAYLNKNSTSDILPNVPSYSAADPYIQSPYLRDGIGEIGFWYRSYDSSPSTIRIMAALSNGAPPSQWTPLYTLSNVTDTTFKYFACTNYDATNYFVRIYCNTNSPPGVQRFCIDNLLITAPYGTTLKLRNLRTDPEVPLHTNTVDLLVDVYDFFLAPYITDVTAYYYPGTNPWMTWPGGTPIKMTLWSDYGTSRTYRTQWPIPEYGVDTVMQYNVSCNFLGLYSDKSSPRWNKTFQNPSWYYPVDLNASRSVTNPYYFVYSCPPGAIWINEINYKLRGDETTNEYVEICGPSDVQVYNWKIELIDTSMASYDSCIITDATIPYSTTNGYGFIVWGDVGVSNVDYVFTSNLSQNIAVNGGVRLVRSMGAYEHRVCYGPASEAIAMTNSGYTYAGYKSSTLRRSPLFLTGSSFGYTTNFTWTYGSSGQSWYSPSQVNFLQTLLGEPVEIPVSIAVTIVNYWIASATNWISFEITGGDRLVPVPLYSTNLSETTWYKVTNSSYAPIGPSTVYTQWFAVQTNSPCYYYKITNDL